MSVYESLVQKLITVPSSLSPPRSADKLALIANYAKALFGGTIHIPSIIVAGTKGKGSTCAVADSVLRHNNLKTGLFTSPHLATPRERIRINGGPISESQYLDAYHRCQSLLTQHHLPTPPFFALHTLMAGLIFTDSHLDAAVIECGIGGRYDWTKLFVPDIAGITNLGYDHLSVLGDTPESISWHKFGVCTSTTANFTTTQSPDFDSALAAHSDRSGLKLTVVPPVYNGRMGLRGPTAECNSALGAALAIGLGNRIGRPITVESGVAAAEIAGRYHSFLSNNIEWLLDGAHTAESVECCCEWYESMNRDMSQDVLMCATTKDRQPQELLARLVNGRWWKKIVWVNGYRPDAMVEGAVSAENLEHALRLVRAQRPRGVLVTGSLHLVGDTLKLLGWRPD
jgi:folylpolyglutamate synthase